MKKFLLYFSISVLFISVGSVLNAQSLVQTLFTEDFEVHPNGMLNVSQPNASMWDTTSRLSSTGNYCDTIFPDGHSFAYLLSPVIDITGFISVNVAFDQIAYLEEFDDAYLEISFDGGFNWMRTSSAYKGGSFLTPGDSAFSSFSRPVKWHFGLSDSMWIPPSTTDAWVTENFDISQFVANQSGASDSLRLRFTMRDDPSSAFGRVGLHTWFLDNIKVTGAPCELIPPTINLDDPFGYIEQYEDVVYYTGPYDFSTQFRDASLIDTSILIYTIKPANAGPWFTDTVQFVVQSGSNYQALIPAQTIGDTVCYRFVVTDASTCKNRTLYPSSGGEICFLVRDNLPPACQTKPIFDFPYYQTFNSTDFALGQTIALADNWLNGTGDFHDWWVGKDSTTTPLTGPIGDVGTGTGKFLYMEATGHLGQTAILFSPCLDLYQIPNASVKFYLNMRGFGGNQFHVDLYSTAAGGYIQDIIPAITGGATDEWFDIEFNTYQYRNTITQLRFRGRTNPSSEVSDIAVDSFSIVYAPLIDLRLESVFLTPFNPEGEQDEVFITVRNLGVLRIDTADIYYEVLDDTGGVIVPAVKSGWSGPIEANILDTIKVSSKYTIPLGNYSIRAWVSAPGDERLGNDTSSIVNSLGLAYRGLDFFDGFDTDTIFQPIPKNSPFGNDWELGTPNGVFTNSAFSEPISWDINLNGGYNGNGQEINLYTPFFDFSNADSMIMYFYNNREMEENSDGVTLYYSLDEGISWDSVPGLHDPKRKYWYNSTLAATGFGGRPVFSDTTNIMLGNENGWVESEVLLPGQFDGVKYALFRFAFFAENDEDGGDGMSIDNFRIVDPVNQNIQAVKITAPNTGCEIGDKKRQIKAIIKNVGNRKITNVPIAIKVTLNDGVNQPVIQTALDTVFAIIEPRDRFKFTTIDSFDFAGIGDYTIEIVTNLPNDPKFENDTMRKYVEHYEGCDVVLLFNTSDAVSDSSRWRMETRLNGREYIFSRPFAGWAPMSFESDKVCVKNGARVKFQLGDIDSSLSTFSVLGYDTAYIDNRAGGPAAPDANFNWICPPQLSARPLKFIFNQGLVQFPLAGDYEYEVVVENNGLDSIDVVRLEVKLDNALILDTTIVFDGTRFPNGLKFRRKRKIGTPPFIEFLDPGPHTFQAITSRPNGLADRQKINEDTLEYTYTIIDTVKANISTTGYSTSFEGADDPKWMSLNSYTYEIENSWILGSPNKVDLNAANTGTNAWVTYLDSNYQNYDSSSLFSPFLRFQKDSCYEFSFFHNYSVNDIFHDGGHVQYSPDAGQSWVTIDNLSRNKRKNWYTTANIASIPFNNQNAGWTGNSAGYVESSNVIGFDEETYGIIRFRFESDGAVNSEGWAIDDFSVNPVSGSECFIVGIDENEFDLSKLQMGQNIPNPATNSTMIPFYLPNSGNIQFMVMNMLGQPVYSESGSRANGDQYIEFNVSNLADGVYYYTMIFENQKITSKMLIAK